MPHPENGRMRRTRSENARKDTHGRRLGPTNVGKQVTHAHGDRVNDRMGWVNVYSVRILAISASLWVLPTGRLCAPMRT